jgi:hypothetical protein
MAKIRFWKWQHTDELGLPGFTRFPISKSKDRKPDDREERAWPLERSPQPAADLLRRPPPQ